VPGNGSSACTPTPIAASQSPTPAAARCGVAVALDSQPLELDWLRTVLRAEFSDEAYPQLVLRLGRVIQVAVSVRREPADVLFQVPDREV
jgi:hypothetical protein